MKNRVAIFVFIVLLVGLCVPAGLAQTTTSVKGVCKDYDGSPIANGVLLLTNQDTGQKYTLTTNKKGEYFSLGITAGVYNVSLYKTADDLKANKQPFYYQNRVTFGMDENTLDFDMKKEQERNAAGQGLTPEQLKQKQEASEKAKKENSTVKVLNEKITAASASMKAGDFDAAVATMTEATQIDATRDVIWGMLGDAYRGAAVKQTDHAERDKRLQEAMTDYQKAIDIKQKAMETGPKKPEDAKQLGAYYNNLADAAGKAGKLDDSVKAYTQAAQVNPEGAAGYYFNAGAVLTNAGKIDDAIAMFDKCIAADPTKADAYYQKGVNLLGKATLQGDKMVAAPGTKEAFEKYLELAPTGNHVEDAKAMLASIGSPVETGFGKKKAPPKK